MDRLTSEFWVSAYLRRCHLEGAYALIRRRGSAQAGSILIVVDRLDGNNDVYAPAPQSEMDDARARAFEKIVEAVDGLAVEERIARELKFDPDIWIVAVEDREGRAFLD